MSEAFYDLGYHNPENPLPERREEKYEQKSRKGLGPKLRPRFPRPDLSGHPCYIEPYQPLSEEEIILGKRWTPIIKEILRNANSNNQTQPTEGAENVDSSSLPLTHEQGCLFDINPISNNQTQPTEGAENVDSSSLPLTHEQGDLFNQQ